MNKSSVENKYWNEKLGELHHRAMTEFRSRCFWNCRPSTSVDGMKSVIDQLQKYGNVKAWKLSLEIENELKNVTT